MREISRDAEGHAMARSIYSDKLKNRTNRLKLPIKKKPYKLLIAPGIFLCYRRNEGPGTWSVNWLQVQAARRARRTLWPMS